MAATQRNVDIVIKEGPRTKCGEYLNSRRRLSSTLAATFDGEKIAIQRGLRTSHPDLRDRGH